MVGTDSGQEVFMEDRRRYMTSYENGSAARKLQPQWETQEIKHPQRAEQQEAQPKVKAVPSIDLISAVFLMTAITATLLVCVNYLKVQSDVVLLNKSISTLEKQITSLDKENDALEAVLENEAYDLETVYQLAVGVLGMVYPNNNEVIYYNNESAGYFRQYQDIPE